ncbi:MAG: Uncharacterised protein [Cellulomonadaceae bacterium TMED98]|nr:MAG: Uncharacterised protein [Cellulomonadaceae bacterium TMED98]
MDPAGEMWSVVTESPSNDRTRAPSILDTGAGVAAIPSKYGGFCTYVDSASHSKVSPVGVGRDFQRSSPSNTAEYSLSNMPVSIDESMVCWTSAALGQISRRKTSVPVES